MRIRTLGRKHVYRFSLTNKEALTVLCSVVKHAESGYLTIIPRARMGSESLAGRMGY